MVFKGKLSQGCSSCRKVHVKCDGGKPECSRCIRLKKPCTGSREPLDLLFRHKSYPIKQESQFKNHENMDVVRVLSNGKSSVINWNQLSPVIPTSTDDLALAFFYTKTLENLPTTDHAHYLHLQLSSLYTTNTHHSALHLAALAISHIVYSRDTRNNIQASQISRKYYVQAIIAINAALRDPVKARSDQTLYAVLLLCGYETVVCDAQSLSAWGSHVDGAIALLRLRGRDCLKRSISRKMYYFIRRSSIMSHIQTAQSMDPLFTDLVDSHCGDESAEDLLLSKTVHIPQLQSKANDLLVHANLNNETKIRKLISNAQKLDENLILWADNVPSSWRYRINPAITSQIGDNLLISHFVPSHFHTYHNVFVGRVWNLYRVSRLIVQSIIMRAMCWLSKNFSLPQDPVDVTRFECIVRILLDDICSSVPFLLGFEANIQSPEMFSSSSDVHWDIWPQNSMKMVNTTMNGKFSLVWPLHVASSMHLAPEIQRDWIKAQIRWLGDVGNIPQASLVARRESQTLLGGAESFRFDCV